MDPQRDHQDSDYGIGATPKLTWAGRIDGTVDGWPVRLVARARTLVLEVGGWRTLLAIRRCWRSIIARLPPSLARPGIRVLVRVRWLGSVEVHPNPPAWVRMLLPSQSG